MDRVGWTHERNNCERWSSLDPDLLAGREELEAQRRGVDAPQRLPRVLQDGLAGEVRAAAARDADDAGAAVH